ncbi:hypothetical protein IAR55_000422 [Kwoniella newhampshirensis]|uniref:Cytidyltransferase-like domain-containing protein n=1 Tax=Kwoniella newhampshirensis TaxID=1651941 RepID=A0AAW0Z6R8_9TREE
MSSKLSLKDHAILVLPFTPFLLHSPAPLLPLISSTLTSSATKSFTILFSTPPLPSASRSRFSEPETSSPTPGSSCRLASAASEEPQHQLYALIRNSPREYFQQFQVFLGKIYAASAAAQWRAGRVMMDVEVHFDGEDGDWGEKLFRDAAGRGECQIIRLEGDNLRLSEPMSSTLSSLPTALIPSPSLPAVEPHRPPVSLPDPTHPVVALGGTFDHLHAAHKLLLHLAFVLTGQKLIVGLMADRLLSSKKHCELVQPLSERLEGVESFLRRLGGVIINTSHPLTEEGSHGETEQGERGKGKVGIAAGEIQDALGPTASDPNIQALVVSRETYSGGEYVNRVRKEQGLGELELYIVDVIADKEGVELGEEREEGKLTELKMGSTGIRGWIKEHGRVGI